MTIAPLPLATGSSHRPHLMRLATWNCRQGIDRKRHALEALGADILVISECNSEPAFARELGASFLWRGDNPRKFLIRVL